MNLLLNGSLLLNKEPCFSKQQKDLPLGSIIKHSFASEKGSSKHTVKSQAFTRQTRTIVLFFIIKISQQICIHSETLLCRSPFHPSAAHIADYCQVCDNLQDIEPDANALGSLHNWPSIFTDKLLGIQAYFHPVVE